MPTTIKDINYRLKELEEKEKTIISLIRALEDKQKTIDDMLVSFQYYITVINKLNNNKKK